MTAAAAEQAFARAVLYRFLSLGFSYPFEEVYADLGRAAEAALVAAPLVSPEVAHAAREAVANVRANGPGGLAAQYQALFTFSASPDCPLNECAYSAKHVYQEVQELADISGFYRAFGVEIEGERSDDLTAELEFSFLLAIKEGYAREQKRREDAAVCRDARRTFLHDHLGRWAENIGRRVEVLAPDTAYAAFGRLLAIFTSAEIGALKAGPVVPYQEVPNPPDPIDDEGCVALTASAGYNLEDEDLIGELMPIAESTAGKGVQ